LKDIDYNNNPEKSLITVPDNFNLPLNRNYKTWGIVLINRKNKFFIINDSNNIDYHVSIENGYNQIEIKNNSNNSLIKTFRDYDPELFIDSAINKKDMFVRYIDNSELFIDGKLEVVKYKSIKFKTNYLKPINKDKKIINKFITLDMETMVINNEHIPYCICFSVYNSSIERLTTYSFYLTDYPDHKEMIRELIINLLRPKYSGYIIQVHNLSNFDGIFLFKSLCNLSTEIDVDSQFVKNMGKINIIPVLREDKMININVKFGPNSKYNISFRDSYLLLPLSLEELAKQFNVKHLKTSFPHNFLNDKLNKKLDLNYIGKIPDVTYFEDPHIYGNFISEYLKFKNNNKKSLSQ
jgi:hypothetical protein